jgi:hypothetical protein
LRESAISLCPGASTRKTARQNKFLSRSTGSSIGQGLA